MYMYKCLLTYKVAPCTYVNPRWDYNFGAQLVNILVYYVEISQYYYLLQFLQMSLNLLFHFGILIFYNDFGFESIRFLSLVVAIT